MSIAGDVYQLDLIQENDRFAFGYDR